MHGNLELEHATMKSNYFARIFSRSPFTAMQEHMEIVNECVHKLTPFFEAVLGHDHSAASENNFVPITCSAIPEELMESELFGHVKGSFTGAIGDKSGLFLEADEGTAFLDEIGELTPIIQTKLLRVLQEREIKPVGSTTIKPLNVRIIAATNRVLEDEIAANRFREDLFYRLAVVPYVFHLYERGKAMCPCW